MKISFSLKKKITPQTSGYSWGIDIVDIGNFVDLPRLMFINKECENLKVVVDGGEFTRNNNRKKKSEVLQAYRCSLCGKCYREGWGKHG